VTLRDFGITTVGAVAVAGLLLGALSLVDRSGVDGDVDTAIGFRVDQLQSLLGLEDPPAGSGTGPALFEGSEERFAVWPEYVDFFEEHPVRGVGLGVGWETTEFSQEPHNIFLELAGETGIVGLAGFAVLIGTVIYCGSGPVGAAALTITFAAALTQTVLFEAAWWFAAGIFLGGGARGRRQR
jgi:O-antigen ligase